MKNICDKARECGYYCPHKEPHEHFSVCDRVTNCNTGSTPAKCIPCEEIEYKKYETKCPHKLNILLSDIPIILGMAFCGDMGGENNCKYCYGHDKKNQKIYCTYKHFNPEVKMEYKVIFNNITMAGMAAKQPCREDFGNACKDWIDMNYGLHEYISPQDLISVARKHNLIRWLIDRCFIKKVEEEFYSVGDEFESFIGNTFKLNSWGEYLVGLNNKGGLNPGCRPLSVEGVFKIPASDFHKHFGDEFKKIKE
jgi:hypothetical protein